MLKFNIEGVEFVLCKYNTNANELGKGKGLPFKPQKTLLILKRGTTGLYD